MSCASDLVKSGDGTVGVGWMSLFESEREGGCQIVGLYTARASYKDVTGRHICATEARQEAVSLGNTGHGAKTFTPPGDQSLTSPARKAHARPVGQEPLWIGPPFFPGHKETPGFPLPTRFFLGFLPNINPNVDARPSASPRPGWALTSPEQPSSSFPSRRPLLTAG